MWRATTERWIIQQRGGASSSAFPISTVPLAFYLCLPLSSNCLHNHLLTLISPSFPLFVFYTAPLFSAVPPTTVGATPPLVPCFPPLVLFIWHSHWHSRARCCPSSLHRWVVIDYCTWIVWWNATRPPNILSSAAPDILLPLCIADCLCRPKFFTSPGCDVRITSLKTLFRTVSLFTTSICRTSDDGTVLYGGERCCLQS